MYDNRWQGLADRLLPRLPVAVVALAATVAIARAQSPASPRLYTNETYLEEVTRTTTLAVTDPVAVFAFVLDSLPDRVKVYPTGNYYYFRFIYNGVPYAGNIRLDTLDRDSGKVHFAYYTDAAQCAGEEQKPDLKVGGVLDASHGVTVEPLERLVYRVTCGRKSVVFALNDLSQVKPPESALGPHERFVGPIFDESGIRFFLVYNPTLRIFHYILDETVKVADELSPAQRTDRILIGKRTGFAFYRDHRLDRKILIGVFEGNRQVNNYFDGPFDQLPDNFIAGDTLREMLLQVAPGLKGQIDRLGYTPDYSGRYTIVPYQHYRTEDDLYAVHQCATSKTLPASLYYKCFDVRQNRRHAHRGQGWTLDVAPGLPR
jgi:hypothetical protein